MFEEDIEACFVDGTNLLAAVKVQERAVNFLTVCIAGHIIRATQSMCIVGCDDDFNLAWRSSVH
jgi:hypothetical protein